MDFDKPYTVPEIAAELEGFTRFAPLPAEDDKLSNRAIIRISIYTALSALGIVFIILPINTFVGTIEHMFVYEYPSFNVVYVTACLCLICSPILLSLIFKIFERKIRIGFTIRLFLYVLSYFCLLTGIFVFDNVEISSYTTDMDFYLELGKDSWAQQQMTDDFIECIFPKEPFEARDEEKGRYHYRSIVEDGYYIYGSMELFAEWTLNDEEFNKEVNRIKNFLSNYDDFKTIQLGDFSCLYSSESVTWYSTADDLDVCKFFAYNPQTYTVRYYFGYDVFDMFADNLFCMNLEW